MKKVFLDGLNKCIDRKNAIDWSNNIGKKIKFIYYDIHGELEIINYEKENHIVVVKYLNNAPYRIRTSNLIYCQLGKCLEVYTDKFRYNIDDVFTDSKRDLIIIDQYYKQENSTRKWYKYKCNKCGYIGEQNETNLKYGNGCSVCCSPPKIIIKGLNDIATTHPNLVKYFLNKEDSYKFSYGSDKYVYMKCPDCGTIRKQKISQLYISGLACQKCGDGVSYPEKFVMSLLKQLKIQFQYQKIFHTNKDKKFDFYFEINDEKYIIETHGRQHYENAFDSLGGRSVEEEINNDKLKKNIAKNNGVNHYIIIDCRESELEWIRNNILNSQLSKIFNLNKINWILCAEYAINNRIKEACNLWNNGIHSSKNIANIMNIVYKTVVEYLKKGADFGWCDYDPVKSKKMGQSKNSGKYSAKSVICINTLEVFNSITGAEKWYHITNICNCCRGKNKYAGKHPETGEPLRWMYYDEYIKQFGEPNIHK